MHVDVRVFINRVFQTPRTNYPPPLGSRDPPPKKKLNQTHEILRRRQIFNSDNSEANTNRKSRGAFPRG